MTRKQSNVFAGNLLLLIREDCMQSNRVSTGCPSSTGDKHCVITIIIRVSMRKNYSFLKPKLLQ